MADFVQVCQLSCAECLRRWPENEPHGWRGLLSDDEPPEVVLFCPECAEREFGEIGGKRG